MKTLKEFLLLICLLVVSAIVSAQQNAMYSQYMFNTLAINPAYAGSRNVVSATGLYRSQWNGIDGAPETTTFTVDGALNSKRIGLGFQLYNDKLGITKTTGAAVSYAYRIRMNEASLSFGLQGSVSQYVADFTSVSLGSQSSYDPAFANNVNKVLFNFGTGVYYNSDRFYLGLSAQDLLNNKLTENNATTDSTMGNRKSIHLFLASGYVFTLTDDFKLKPSFLVKGVKGAPLEADFNATLWIKDVLAIGAQYRSSADLAGILEVQATPQIRIGYSYDHSITRLRNFNTGSHEIMLRYEFGSRRGKILSPRYF